MNDISKREQSFLVEFSFNIEDEEGNPYEICQYFIITRDGYEFLEEFAPDEILFYDNELDIHIWGITHWGTPWKYIFTNIKAERA